MHWYCVTSRASCNLFYEGIKLNDTTLMTIWPIFFHRKKIEMLQKKITCAQFLNSLILILDFSSLKRKKKKKKKRALIKRWEDCSCSRGKLKRLKIHFSPRPPSISMKRLHIAKICNGKKGITHVFSLFKTQKHQNILKIHVFLTSMISQIITKSMCRSRICSNMYHDINCEDIMWRHKYLAMNRWLIGVRLL